MHMKVPQKFTQLQIWRDLSIRAQMIDDVR